jgi:hypothetical protein
VGRINPHPLRKRKTQRMRNPQNRSETRLKCGVRRIVEANKAKEGDTPVGYDTSKEPALRKGLWVNPPRGFTGQRRRYENRVSASRQRLFSRLKCAVCG